MDLKLSTDSRQLKNMTGAQRTALCQSIREFLLENISRTGGHLSSNLGAVELTVALHTVFSPPKDKIIFDVGHQSYTHKILTGRACEFGTLRQYGGLSGYQKRMESDCDPWESGHSSTSISAAMGLAAARDLKHEDFEVIAVIGDGALSGGMALEALNDLGAQQRKVIVIFNDNNMSISYNHAGFEKRITRMRSSGFYRNVKKELHSSLKNNELGKGLLGVMHQSKEYLKDRLIDAPLFEGFSLDYLGPVDGHNLDELIPALEAAREHDGPIVVHVQTQKGKGYPFAEQDTIGKWHGVGPFDLATGEMRTGQADDRLSWSEVISRSLMELAEKDPDIVAITPAMANGSKLLEFAKTWPDRFFDCGIAEEHAMTMAGGMAQGGLKPFVSIYSSFLQRAYDQVSHDVARMDLPVVVGIDRAGLVGDDGETHQGIFDIAFLRTIPNIVLSQPRDALEARGLLKLGFESGLPFFLRYPRGSTEWKPGLAWPEIELGRWSEEDVGEPRQIVLAYGPQVDQILQKARINSLPIKVVNARFFKPIDETMLRRLFESGLPITVYETDSARGGLMDAVLEYANEQGYTKHIAQIALPPAFIPHGSVPRLRKEFGISLDDLFAHLEQNDPGRPDADTASVQEEEPETGNAQAGAPVQESLS